MTIDESEVASEVVEAAAIGMVCGLCVGLLEWIILIAWIVD